MKKRLSTKNAFFLLTALASGIVIFTFFHLLSAEISPLSAIDDSITAGKQQLFSRTVSGALQAHQTFLSATNQYDATADNSQKIKLHFYLALTRLADIILRNDGQGADTLRKLLAQYGITFTGDNFDAIASHLPANAQDKPILPASAPSGDALRAFLAGPFLTALNASLADMDTVIGLLGSSESKEILLKSLLDPQSQNASLQDVEVDDGDYYLLRTGLKALKVYILTWTAYNQDFDARELAALINADMGNLQSFLDRHPDLLKVRTGGPAALAEAKQTFISAIDDYMIASDKIRNDISLQPGATELITIDNYAWQGDAQARTRLMQIRTSLTDPAQPVVQFIEHNEDWNILTTQGGITTTRTTHFYDDFTKGNFSSSDGSWGNLDYATIKGIQVSLRFTIPGGWVELTGMLSNNNTQMAGTYSGWSMGGNFSGTFTGARTASTDIASGSKFNLNPIFGNGTTALNLRDLLPQFSPFGGGQPVAGTMGHGLGDDPTLGGIVPDQTQALWQEDQQPSKTFTIPTKTITVDGDVSDWSSLPPVPPVFVDVTGETDPGRDLTKLYLAKDGTYLYFRIDLAGAYASYNEYQLRFRKLPGNAPDVVGDVYYAFSYPTGTPAAWQLIKRTYNTSGTWSSSNLTAQNPKQGDVSASGSSIEGRILLSTASGTPIVGELGGRFIGVRTSPWNNDSNDTSIQIVPAATVTGTLTIPDYNGAGLIFVEAYSYVFVGANGVDTTKASKLGGQVIYPGQYTPGMNFTVDNLPVGERIFVFFHWDKDMDGLISTGDYTNFYQQLTTVAGNNPLPPVVVSDNHPVFPLVEFKDTQIFSNRNQSNNVTIFMQAFIGGPSPDDVTITVHGPAGDYTLEPSKYHQQEGLSYNIPSATRPSYVPDGDYTFEAVDSLGRRVTSASYHYSFNGSLPLVNTASMIPANRTFVGTTTPTLTWQAPGAGTYYYQVRVQDWLGNDIWFDSDIITATSVTVPAGLLQPDTAYTWSVRVYDSADHPMNRTATNDLSFHTGDGGAPALLSTELYTRTPAPGSTQRYQTSISPTVSNVFPDDIKYIALKGPSPATTVWGGCAYTYNVSVAPPISYGYSRSANYTFNCSPNPSAVPGKGTYTIQVKYQRTGEAAQTTLAMDTPFEYKGATAPVDLSSFGIPDNYYFDTTTPRFSWSPAGDPNTTYYRLRIGVLPVGTTIWTSGWTKDTSVVIPPGILVPGRSYDWSMRSSADYDPSRSSTTGKYNSYIDTIIDGSRFSFTVNRSQALFPAPEFKSVRILSRRVASEYKVIMSAYIKGPSPDDVTITADGPGGSFTLLPYKYHRQQGLLYEYVTPANVNLAAGDYTFKAVDSQGRKAQAAYHYEYNGTLPFVEASTFSPVHRGFVGTTVPTLSWQAPAGGVYYEVRVEDLLGDYIWFQSAIQTATSLTVPAGLLKPDTPYKWYVRVYDSDGNRMNSTQSADSYFHTGTAQTPALTQATVRTQPTGMTVRNYLTYIDVHQLFGVFPDEVKTFRLIGPSGTVVATGAPSIVYGTSSAYYRLSYSAATPPATGDYLLEVDYQRSGETQVTTLRAAPYSFAYHPVLPVDIAKVTPKDNYYFDTVTPAFSWNPVNDPGAAYYYRLQVRDPMDINLLWQSGWTTAATTTVPVGVLMRGGTYSWRVQFSSDYNPPQGATTEKYDSQDLMEASGKTVSFRFTVNPGIVPVLKGDLNDDEKVDMMDAILALQIFSGKNPGLRRGYSFSGADVGNNGAVGMEDLLFILQWVSGLRQ